jgi:hypothetical protein
VLGEPDSQGLFDENDAFTAFVDAVVALRLSSMAEAPCEAWLLKLDGRFAQCSVRTNQFGPPKSLTLLGGSTAPGMSGSPIMIADGRAVGVVSLGSSSNNVASFEEHGQPLLERALPGWLLSEFGLLV